MRRLTGFVLFWIAVGMTIMLFIGRGLLAFILILLCYFLSYRYYHNCR